MDNFDQINDPFLNIYELFCHYKQKFFSNVLDPVSVEWSSKMTLCAGICKFSKVGMLKECRVVLSEPLLKFRPNSDLLNTLLHEMIHAYLFMTGKYQASTEENGGHGPEFLELMYSINMIEKTNITVYHSFHDEVDLYRVHWWKCQRCGRLVKRAMNRAPSSADYFWDAHQKNCAGEFLKFREPWSPKISKKMIALEKKNNRKHGTCNDKTTFANAKTASSIHRKQKKKQEKNKSEDTPKNRGERDETTGKKRASSLQTILDDFSMSEKEKKNHIQQPNKKLKMSPSSSPPSTTPISNFFGLTEKQLQSIHQKNDKFNIEKSTTILDRIAKDEMLEDDDVLLMKTSTSTEKGSQRDGGNKQFYHKKQLTGNDDHGNEIILIHDDDSLSSSSFVDEDNGGINSVITDNDTDTDNNNNNNEDVDVDEDERSTDCCDV